MARHPASDERSVLGPAAKPREGERFFVPEMARFLRCSKHDLRKFLRSVGLLRIIPLSHSRPPVAATTARGFALALVHFRTIQGEKALIGEKAWRLRQGRLGSRR
jgi:hypothetical protein